MPTAVEPFELGPGPWIRGETAGEGTPIVLCHGVTATRRYVVHGSRALERAGHRVISYDARGHGSSDPAPSGGGYGYPELVGDLERVLAEQAGPGPVVLAGHSMGAHTAVSFALQHPQRVAGLVVIGPVYTGPPAEGSLAYWDGLADALESGGVDGFVEYIGREQATDPRWREAVLRFTRERISAHRHPQAIVEALRQVPRSRPFDSMERLRSLEVPALVVASGDEADPGHPYEVAVEYARLLPRARLISEEGGQSPLAWQGGRLSRAIADFCAAEGAKP
jgi:pimeloyl-ACP methyl ester carboxylesterase